MWLVGRVGLTSSARLEGPFGLMGSHACWMVPHVLGSSLSETASVLAFPCFLEKSRLSNLSG